MSLAPRSHTVHFTVTGRPDHPGLRIKTTDPIGLYITSADKEAAQWYFEHTVASFLMARKILCPGRGEGCSNTTLVDWSSSLLEGVGALTVCISSVEEIMQLCSVGERIVSPPVRKLRCEIWQYPNGTDFCLISDPEGHIDDWMIEAVKADITTMQ